MVFTFTRGRPKFAERGLDTGSNIIMEIISMDTVYMQKYHNNLKESRFK